MDNGDPKIRSRTTLQKNSICVKVYIWFVVTKIHKKDEQHYKSFHHSHIRNDKNKNNKSTPTYKMYMFIEPTFQSLTILYTNHKFNPICVSLDIYVCLVAFTDWMKALHTIYGQIERKKKSEEKKYDFYLCWSNKGKDFSNFASILIRNCLFQIFFIV